MSYLEIKNLNYAYDKQEVLQNINFQVEPSEILLIKGENGSGKTTLLKCISGILNSGKNIYLNGQHLQEKKDLLQNISYIMSEDTLYEYLSVLENIKLYKELFKESDEFIERVRQYIKAFNTQMYDDYLIKHLSQGTRHKIYLAIMLSRKTDIILLDEPFTSLDKKSQKWIIHKIIHLIKEEHKCILLVTHMDEFCSLATRTYYLHKEGE